MGAVKVEFEHAWKSYRKYAFGADELKPVSGEPNSRFCGWAATLIDSLDTLWIMGLMEDYEAAVQYASRIDWSKTADEKCSLNVFEMVIRHLGGLLSVYDLAGPDHPHRWVICFLGTLVGRLLT